MQRFWEIIFGLERGFLQQEGELSLRFNPPWPWQEVIGAALWNAALAAAALLLVLYVYRREGRSRGARIALGTMRAFLLVLVILLLNRPMLNLTQSHTEPSVLAVMIDTSISMRVKDVADDNAADADAIPTRLEAAIDLLKGEERALLRELAETHVLQFYEFDRGARPLGTLSGDDLAEEAEAELAWLAELEPLGQSTQVLGAVRSVLQDLQGRRLAGVVMLTDGRETPTQPLTDAFNAITNHGVKVFPVPLGSDRDPRNVEVHSVNVQESAFMGDIVNVKAMVRATGYAPGHAVQVVLKNKATGVSLYDSEGAPAEQTVYIDDDSPVEVELQFMPQETGMIDVVVEAVEQPGELDDEDNVRVAQVEVLEADIRVLYVDGYPRWEYRYIKDEMIRDRTVIISCLLTSADPAFAQEGDRPITRFPESMEELMEYDVVVFGDVDPRQFTDRQLQLVAEFVAQKGGGFGMVAGPRWSPQTFRNTAIEPILPVGIQQVESGQSGTITEGFRPVLTPVGEDSSIFRFFADRERNQTFIRDEIQPLFWYARGVTAKPGVGEVYAEHPDDIGPDGRNAPILVMGRFGAGRTLFSAIDDSWRWRFYTGEHIFDTYWVQQLRHLARSRKLGQRRLTLTSLRPAYELGEQVRVSLRVLDPQLLQQLPAQIRVDIVDSAGQPVRQQNLVRQEGQADLYVASWTADRLGRFSVRLPPIAGGVEAMALPLEVRLPRLELAQPQVDRTLLTRLASETLGETVAYEQARQRLPAVIPSAAKIIPVETAEPLWDTPLVMLIFMLFITGEWVLRKMYGMI